MERQTYRKQHKFWLDIARDDEFILAETLAERKAQRQYTATIRDALTLLFDLQSGNTGVLVDMFPGICQQMKGNGGNGAGGDDTGGIDEKLSRLESILLQQSIPNGLIAHARTTAEAIPADMPSLFVAEAHSDPSEARVNFAAGMGDLFDSDDDELWE